MFNKIKISVLDEVIEALEPLLEKYDDKAKALRDMNEDNNFEIGVTCGLQYAISTAIDIRRKYM